MVERQHEKRIFPSEEETADTASQTVAAFEFRWFKHPFEIYEDPGQLLERIKRIHFYQEIARLVLRERS